MNIIESNLKFGPLSKRSKTTAIVQHHAEATTCSIYDIHQWHLNNGWSGCGYHFFIRKDGSVYRGRPVDMVGSHCLNHNAYTIGICFEGNVNNTAPTDAQYRANAELVAYLKKMYPSITSVKRHKDLMSTDCPGAKFDLSKAINGVGAVVTGEINPGKAVNERNVCYQAHVQNKGWLARVRDAIWAGTKKLKLRLEALRIDISNIIGELELEVTVNIANVGQKTYIVTKDNPDQIIGSVGDGNALEMITIRVIKNTTRKVLKMQGHVSGVGDTSTITLGPVAKSIGSMDRATPLEAFRMWLADN